MVPVFATVAQNQKKRITALLLNKRIVFFNVIGEQIGEISIAEMIENKDEGAIVNLAKKLARKWIELFH